MGKQYAKLKAKDVAFIEAQKLFFIASCSGREVNLSPKGYDVLRVLDAQTLLYLDYPGSGNRTYRDAINDGEFTLMFNAFEGKANITKLFCKAEHIGKEDRRFDTLIKHYDVNIDEVRQLFLFHIYAVETSCGDGVPFMEYKGDRPSLKEWAAKMSKSGKLEAYMKEHKVPPTLENLS